MPCVTRKNDHASWWIRRHFLAIELVTEADVENAGHDGIDAVFRMFMRHELDAERNLDADHIRAGLRRLTDNDGEADRGWKGHKRLPIDLLRQDRPECCLTWLVGSDHV